MSYFAYGTVKSLKKPSVANKIRQKFTGKELDDTNEEEKETGLYKDLKNLSKIVSDANKKLSDTKSNLELKLTSKATAKNVGIKYQSDRFGDQNYNISKLKQDITTITAKSFNPIDEAKEKELSNIIEEKP